MNDVSDIPLRGEKPVVGSGPVSLLADGTLVAGGSMRIIHDVAHGAGGTVYKAQEIPSGRLIALKVLEGKAEHRADAEPRLLAEAQYASALGPHANIVRPVRWGHLAEAGARPFMATEFVDGPTLASLADRTVPVLLKCRVLQQLADVLAALHARGIVHRDVKPDNVMLAREGAEIVPKLTDFGLAGVIAAVRSYGDVELTGVHDRPGTKHYMAPEQCLGMPLAGSFDVYALGVTAYELFTGAPPWGSNTGLEVVMRKCDSSQPSFSLSRLEMDLPGDVGGLVDRALLFDAAHRPSAAEFREAMAAVVARLETGLPEAVVSGDEGPADATQMISKQDVARLLAEAGTQAGQGHAQGQTLAAPALPPVSRIEAPPRRRADPERRVDVTELGPRAGSIAVSDEAPTHAITPVATVDVDADFGIPRLGPGLQMDPGPWEVITPAQVQAVMAQLGTAVGSVPGKASPTPTDVPRLRAADPERRVDVTELGPRAGEIVVAEQARARSGDTEVVLAVPAGLTQVVGKATLAQVIAAAAAAEAARAGVAQGSEQQAAPAAAAVPRSVEIGAPRWWIAGAVALVVVAVFALWWIDRAVTPGANGIEVSGAAVVERNPPRVEPSEPATPTSAVPSAAPPSEPPPSAPAPSGSAGAIVPDTEPTPPEPAPPARAKARTSPPKPLAESKPPAHESDACTQIREQVPTTRARGDYSALLGLLARKECWADKRVHKREFVRALAESGDFARCATAGRGSSDPAVVRFVSQCEDMKGASAP